MCTGHKMCFIFLFIQNVFAPINIKWVMLEVHEETHAGLHGECLLLLCNFNGLWNVTKTLKNQISWKSVRGPLAVVICRQTKMLKITGAYLQLFIMNMIRMDCYCFILGGSMLEAWQKLWEINFENFQFGLQIEHT